MKPKKRRLRIKKIQLLIERKIGDRNRLETMQMTLGRGLPLFKSEERYLNELISKHITSEEIELLRKELDVNLLKKYNNSNIQHHKHCMRCENIVQDTNSDGMCTVCYYEYNMKISKFVTVLKGH